jgi:chromosome partitioning protein
VKVISIMSQKGGVGKTTLSINLAVAAEKEGESVIILDLDPQTDATDWSDYRGSNSPIVESIQPKSLFKCLNICRGLGADLVIVDTARHSESDAFLLARQSDLILIPCRPAILDLRGIQSSVDLANLLKKKYMVILNCVPPKGSLPKESEQALKEIGVNVCNITIGNRAAFIHSTTQAESVLEYEPKGKASKEIENLYFLIKETFLVEVKDNDISKFISDPVSKNKPVVRGISEEFYNTKYLGESIREIVLSFSLGFDKESRIKDIIKKDSSFEELYLKEILELSKIIKSIKAQEVLIVGKAIKKAQTILANYNNGMFSEWLVEMFGNVQTPYNFLRFFELHTLLKERSQKEYLSIPRRAAYKLAKVEGSTEQKEEFISQGKNKNASSLEEEIDILFPKYQRVTKTRKV